MLTDAQQAILRTAVKAALDAPTIAAYTAKDASALVVLYDAAALPDFWVWRTRVAKSELTNAVSQDGTIFAWTGAGFITRSVGERDAWRELFDADGMVNPALPQVRQAFLDIFSGATAPAPANRTHLATVGRRKATRLEQLFAVGTGSTASPALMGYEGGVLLADMGTALWLPDGTPR